MNAQLSSPDVFQELAARVDPGVLVQPDATGLARHTRDFTISSPPGTEVIAIAYPRNTQQVSRILAWCNAQRIAVVPQGGMTGLAGGAVPFTRSVLVSLERMRNIEEVDPAANTITVEAGVVLEAVQKAADAADLLFPLDLGGRGSCQVGGNASTNAGGNRVLRFGMMRDLILGVEAVLADGTIVSSLNKVIKNNTGYDLRQLFIGSEGTLGIITRLVLRLFPKPTSVCTGLVALRDYPAVVDFLRSARKGFGSSLTAFEVMWPEFYRIGTTGLGRKPPLEEGHGLYVLLETMGTDVAADRARFETVIGESLDSGLVQDAVIAQSERETRDLWAIRDCPGEFPKVYWPQIGFDVSVPTGEIGDLVEECRAELTKRWPQVRMLPFGHVADGNLHLSVNLPDVPEPDVEDAVYRLVSARKGSISAEHGIGQYKRDYLHYSRSPAEIATMRAIKAALDPNGILNPGKVLP